MDEKPCGLIVMIPPALAAEWAEKLAELVAAFKPAALILQSPAGRSADIIAKAKAFELAVLMAGTVEAAQEAGAAGVYFPNQGAAVSRARAALGGGGIIGASCGLSRHAAMECAEAGADFVAFDASSPGNMDQAAQLSHWWDEIATVAVALLCGEVRPDRAALGKARPDFLILEDVFPGESLTFATELGLQSQS